MYVMKGGINMQKEVSKLNPQVKRYLHILSFSGTYMMLFGFIFIIQIVLFGFIPKFKNLTLFDIPLSAILFSFTSILIINKFFRINTPYE